MRKAEHESSSRQFEQQWQLQKDAVDKLKDQLRSLNDKIEEAKRKKNILIARAEARRGAEDHPGHDDRPVRQRPPSTPSSAWPTRSTRSRRRPRPSRSSPGELTGDIARAPKFKKLETPRECGADTALAELKAKMGLAALPASAESGAPKALPAKGEEASAPEPTKTAAGKSE